MGTFCVHLTVWTKLFLVIVLHEILALNVTIISLLPHDINVGVSLRWTGPALTAAVEDSNAVFEPRLRTDLKLIFSMNHQTCFQAREDVPRMLTEYFYEQKLEKSCVALVGASE